MNLSDQISPGINQVVSLVSNIRTSGKEGGENEALVAELQKLETRLKSAIE